MKKDGADSPLPPVAAPVAVAASAAKAPEAKDSVTLARPKEEAPMPPRPPMPHARIRPTASFPRVVERRPASPTARRGHPVADGRRRG